MKKLQAIQVVKEYDRKGVYVFTNHDLKKLFPEDSPKAFSEGLRRLEQAGILERVCRGVYLNASASSFTAYVIEEIAKTLRRGEYNYVSLESALAEYGVISQIPIDRIRIMTTGRKGVYQTPYGVIEFTHTDRSRKSILDSIMVVPGRPLRIAKKEAALRDLKRVGRNLDLINLKELDDD